MEDQTKVPVAADAQDTDDPFELFGTTTKFIMDPVHGGIGFSETEAKVIAHPLFQRLRFISQNDILSLVFPGATHARFTHSIGAMHMAGRVFRAMVRGTILDAQKAKLPVHRVMQVQPIRDAIRYFYDLLRLAGLMHDLGHAPFSHQFEHSEANQRVLKSQGLLEELWKGEPLEAFYPDPKKRPEQLEHEHYSVRAAYQVLKEIGEDEGLPVAAEDVLALLDKVDGKVSAKFEAHVQALLLGLKREGVHLADCTGAFRNFLKSIISSEIDIDKMDYLMRDSYFSGCKYGIFNADHLINTLRIGFKIANKQVWVGIAIHKKGLLAFEDFVYCRFQMYQEVYNHKNVGGFKLLLGKAMEEVSEDKDFALEIGDSLRSISRFQDLTDYYFWSLFRQIARKDQGSACYKLINREKLKHVWGQADVSSSESNELLDELGSKSDQQGNYPIEEWYAESKFSGIEPKYDKIRILVKEKDGKPKLEDLKKHTHFFGKFQKATVTHYYEIPKQIQVKKRRKRDAH